MSAAAPTVVTRRRWSIPGLRGTGAMGNASAVVIAVAVLVAIVGPWVTPHDPDAVDLKFSFVGAYEDHFLGFDGQGRDIVSRLLAGARTSLLGPLMVVGISMVAGTALAIAAAWKGGRFDTVVSTCLNILFSFPAIVLAIISAVVWGAGLKAASLALAVAYLPYIARVLRGAALRERSRDYIAALEVQGLRAWVICVRHLARNLLPLLSAQAAVLFGYAMVDLAAISFIGLGVQPPQADWGVMVATGQSGVLQGYPMESLSAGLCIIIVVIAVNLLGEKLTERANEVIR